MIRALAGLVCCAGLATSAMAAAQTMSRLDYLTGNGQIVQAHRAARAECAVQNDHAGALCRIEATNASNIATAELNARYKPGANTQRDLQRARIDAAYATARERCNAEPASTKLACVRRAETHQTAAYAKLEPDGR